MTMRCLCQCLRCARIKLEFIVVFICVTNLSPINVVADSDCALTPGKDESLIVKEKKLLERLEPLKGLVFSVTSKADKTTYNYTVGICTSVNKNDTTAGAIQSADTKEGPYTLGRFNATQIFSGSNWIMLIYTSGDKYGKLCDKQSRETKIMVTCDPHHLAGNFQMLEERTGSGEENFCHYLFELESKVVCTEESPSGLSGGSVFCIIFITFAIIYILVGFLYRRIVVGAKGMEQIPNYSFWKDFGNLEADGCDFLCRCGPRNDMQAYRGIDDPLEREVDKDDQLLPM